MKDPSRIYRWILLLASVLTVVYLVGAAVYENYGAQWSAVQRQYREILREKATRDSLTGLLNHEEILGILDKELARSERDGVYVSIIMADIDHFKKINDTYGHLAGDAVLRIIAQKMHSMERSYDAIGRYGGEEFCVLTSGLSRDEARQFSEKLRLSICALDIENRSSPHRRLTASAGFW